MIRCTAYSKQFPLGNNSTSPLRLELSECPSAVPLLLSRALTDAWPAFDLPFRESGYRSASEHRASDGQPHFTRPSVVEVGRFSHRSSVCGRPGNFLTASYGDDSMVVNDARVHEAIFVPNFKDMAHTNGGHGSRAPRCLVGVSDVALTPKMDTQKPPGR